MTEAKGWHSTLVVNCVLNSFLSSTAILLNIITIQALRKTPSLSKPLKTLLLSLAVSDLGVGFLVQPTYVAGLVMKIKQNADNGTYYNHRRTGNFLSGGAVNHLPKKFLQVAQNANFYKTVEQKRGP